MTYAEKNLLNDETIIQQTYGHWVAFLPSLGGTGLALVLWIILPAYMLDNPNSLLHRFDYNHLGSTGLHALGWLLVLGAIAFLIDYVRWIAEEFAITDRRILIKRGIVFRDTAELFLDRVESVHVEQSVLGRMLGFGTVRVVGTGETSESLCRVPRPLAFRQTVQEQASHKRQKGHHDSEEIHRQGGK